MRNYRDEDNRADSPLPNSPRHSSKIDPIVDHGPHVQEPFSIDIPPAEPEIRKDYIFNDYVIIAPKRKNRPFDQGHNLTKQLIETASSPRLDLQPEVFHLNDPGGHWVTKVVDNKYPSLTLDNPKAYGKQEIVLDTPQTNIQIGALSQQQIVYVLKTYQYRIKTLSALPNIYYVLVFKNEGVNAGASLAHAHTQIFALPVIPNRFLAEAKEIDDYITANGRDPFDDIISFEEKANSRIVVNNASVLAFCPYAPAWQMEAWLLPKRPVQNFADLTEAEINDWATALKKITNRLGRYNLSYNYFIQNGTTSNQRLILKIRGREIISPRAGFEISTGMSINAIPPEAAARWYRAD